LVDGGDQERAGDDVTDVNQRRPAGSALWSVLSSSVADGRNGQAATLSTAPSTAADHQESCHVPWRRISTSTPEAAIPAPTPPNPCPTRCSPWARSPVSSALAATMNTSALAHPAMNRRAAQLASPVSTGISASVATTTISDDRYTVRDRSRAGAATPASAPAK
jgi:hypothetical protein